MNAAGRKHGGAARPGARAEAARERAAAGRLLSAKAASTYTGLPYSSLRELAFKNEISVVKFGSRWFFKREDLDRLIELHTERLS